MLSAIFSSLLIADRIPDSKTHVGTYLTCLLTLTYRWWTLFCFMFLRVISYSIDDIDVSFIRHVVLAISFVKI